MSRDSADRPDMWELGRPPTLADPLPRRMSALTLHRDRYGRPADVLEVEPVELPSLGPADAGRVLVSILATGPNFNTNFAALGLPVPVFGRGESATMHSPGSDALATYRAVLGRTDPASLALSGDSAGGGLTTSGCPPALSADLPQLPVQLDRRCRL